MSTYFTREQNSIVPDFNINKVFVDSNSVRILCSLKRDTDLDYNAWLGSSEFLKYVNFHFLLATRALSDADLSDFYYPKTRISSLASRNNFSLTSWKETLGRRPSMRSEYRNNYYSQMSGHTMVSYESIEKGTVEFTNRGYLTEDSGQDITNYAGSGFSNLSGIQGNSNIALLANNNDVYFEVEIVPASRNWIYSLDGLGTVGITRDISIIAFSQLDVGALSVDFRLNDFVGNLSTYGGPMKFQNILRGTYDPAGIDNNGNTVYKFNWDIPRTAAVYTDEQGNPYEGIVHYHSEENPGPNGYIGWMSGPAGDDPENPMDQRKRLSRVEVQNTKVSSKIFLQRALDPNGNPISYTSNGTAPIGPDTRYVGFEYQPLNPVIEVVQNRTPSPHGILTIGENLLDTLKKEIGMVSMSPGNPLYEQKIKHMSILGQRKNNPAFFSGFNQEFKNSSWINIGNSYGDSYYGIMAIMNRENLLEFNSRLGYLLDFHAQEATVGSTFQGPRFDTTPGRQDSYNPEALSYDFLRTCYTDFTIYGLKISRRRVTNSMSSNNQLGTPSYENYDTDQIEETVFLSSNREGAPLSFLENNLGNRATVEVMEMESDSTGNSHVVILRDYDLFRNIDHGNYQYTVEISLSNTIFDVLKGLYDNFETLLQRYSELLNVAKKPFYFDHQTQTHNFGSYNYEAGVFSQHFIDQASALQMTSNVSELSYQYMRILYLLTKRSDMLSDSHHKHLIESLTPEKGDLSNMEYFMDLCLKLQTLFRKVIFPGGNRHKERENYGTNRTSPKTNSYFDKVIRAKSKLKNTVTVASKNSVFFAPTQNIDGQQSNDFFTMTTTPRTFAPNLPRPNYDSSISRVVSYNSAGDINRLSFNPFSRTSITTREGVDMNSVLASSIQRSNYGEVYDSSTPSQFSDPVQDLDGLMFYATGTTLSDLLSMHITSEDPEAQQQDTGNIAQALRDSVIASEGVDDFKRKIDQMYENQYFTEANLGQLYQFVRSILSMKNLEFSLDESTGQNFEMLVKNRMPIGQSNRAQMNSTLVSRTDAQAGPLMTRAQTNMLHLTSQGAWVSDAELTTNMQVTLTGVTMHMPVGQVGTPSAEAVIVNNVTVSSPSMRVSTGLSPLTVRTSSGLSSGASGGASTGATTSTGTTTGTTTSGGGGGASGY